MDSRTQDKGQQTQNPIHDCYTFWCEPINKSFRFWEITKGFYRLLYKSYKYGLPLSIQIEIAKDESLQVTTTIYNDGQPAWTYVRQLLSLQHYILWEEAVATELIRTGEELESSQILGAEDLASLIALYQKLFCELNHLFFKVNRLGEYIAFKLLRRNRDIQATAIYNRAATRSYTKIIETEEQIEDFAQKTSSDLQVMFNLSDCDWHCFL